jgi:deoxyribodipyrimidine photo-lyase
MINDRIQSLKSSANMKGDYILYWMQQSQRIAYNHALIHAINLSNDHQLPLVVYFGVTDRYPEANLRHYHFMMAGLHDLQKKFKGMKIRFVIYKTSPETGCIELMKNAAYLVMDKGYTRTQREWRQEVLGKAQNLDINIDEVESDLVIPIETTSNKEEYAARTIRTKIMSKIREYAVEPDDVFPQINSLDMTLDLPFEEITDPMASLESLDIDTSVKPSERFKGGETEAQRVFSEFLETRLPHYTLRNHPELDYCSYLSPYLHFGHISPVEIVVRTIDALRSNSELEESVDSFIEELVVRRELSHNFIYFNPNYDSFKGMTYQWAYDTMELHNEDQRDYLYSIEEFENCATHDPYWNAAMKEMVHTGFMHTYMRMYWCKKIIEWTPDCETAYEIAISLNNKYFLDGRDANSFTGVAWCFGKHDRPWTERSVFGKLRYMNDNGLKRKFDIDAYVKKINSMIGE